MGNLCIFLQSADSAPYAYLAWLSWARRRPGRIFQSLASLWYALRILFGVKEFVSIIQRTNSTSLRDPAPYLDVYRVSSFRQNCHSLRCNENPIYVFPEKELRSLRPNFHIHVSVSDLYIPRIGPHIFLQQNRQTFSGNLCFKFSVLYLRSVQYGSKTFYTCNLHITNTIYMKAKKAQRVS